MIDTPRTDAVENEANERYRDGEWRAFSPTEGKGWAFARQLERENVRLFDALAELVARCDCEEGVRADGSNIQTMRASALLRELGEER